MEDLLTKEIEIMYECKNDSCNYRTMKINKIEKDEEGYEGAKIKWSKN
jgi:hypothetical protein